MKSDRTIWQCSVAVLGVALLVALPATAQVTHERAASKAPPIRSINDSVGVTDAWARPALKGGTGGAYMTITNRSHSAIRIVSATANVAAAVELHVSSVHDGMAHMEMLPNLLVAPGASVSLKPGGTHFMLVGLHKALVKGETAQLKLQLNNGDQIVVNVAVRVQ